MNRSRGRESRHRETHRSGTDSLLSSWSQSAFFRKVIRLGAVKSTVIAVLAIDLFSLTLAVAFMLAFNRLSWMGILISGSIPLFLVPLHWYPFARISEQLAATESLLRKSEGKYRSILEKMNEAYIEVDKSGGLTFFNDSLCRITGYGRAELEQRSVADFTGNRDFRRLALSAGQLAKSGRIGSLFDFPIIVSGGATRYLDVSFSLLHDEENRWCGYHAVLFDVTEKMVASREKRAIEDQLARAKRMESLGILAGGVAHDLNNIVAEYLQSPEHAQLQRSFPDIAVATVFDPGLLNIEGGTLPLYKSVMNLVLNAFESITPPGRVSLTTENRYLDRPLRGYDHVKPGEYATLTVADTGAGISPEDRERIFEPFYTKKIMGRSGTGPAPTSGSPTGWKRWRRSSTKRSRAGPNGPPRVRARPPRDYNCLLDKGWSPSAERGEHDRGPPGRIVNRTRLKPIAAPTPSPRR